MTAFLDSLTLHMGSGAEMVAAAMVAGLLIAARRAVSRSKPRTLS